jgi:succinate-semialdehyde dehydrogenase/glutarate-semialdehyde dehydrogenase
MIPGSTRAAAGDYWDTHVLASGLGRGTVERLGSAVSAVSTGGGRITVPVPFTSEPLGTVPNCTPEEVQEAVRRARLAQPEWARRSLSDRRSILIRFHDLVLARREQVLDLIQLESGKARA